MGSCLSRAAPPLRSHRGSVLPDLPSVEEARPSSYSAGRRGSVAQWSVPTAQAASPVATASTPSISSGAQAAAGATPAATATAPSSASRAQARPRSTYSAGRRGSTVQWSSRGAQAARAAAAAAASGNDQAVTGTNSSGLRGSTMQSASGSAPTSPQPSQNSSIPSMPSQAEPSTAEPVSPFRSEPSTPGRRSSFSRLFAGMGMTSAEDAPAEQATSPRELASASGARQDSSAGPSEAQPNLLQARHQRRKSLEAELLRAEGGQAERRRQSPSTNEEERRVKPRGQSIQSELMRPLPRRQSKADATEQEEEVSPKQTSPRRRSWQEECPRRMSATLANVRNFDLDAFDKQEISTVARGRRVSVS
eukprot:TRINITY_DN24585_c0_g1_i2.p1 TRINITY_DN24585_c0_g1~~TRINITY_DN24585_c0_g1_i2.p1  ORF type:complete len:371 (-),score=73.53 TRINITY_DN24585_c0_g1_i2:149-1240(-)